MTELEKALKWRAEHPHIYEKFVRRALKGRRDGLRHLGARAIIGSLRYETALRERSGNVWKISDRCIMWLARWATKEHPELDGFFRMREMKQPGSAKPSSVH